jgi:hypothetical protein
MKRVYTGNNVIEAGLAYKDTMKNSIKSSSSSLLLPCVSIPEEKHESAKEILAKLSVSTLSGVDSVSVVSYIQEKTTDAFLLARHYRDIAEKVRIEHIEATQKMNNELQVVESFWRKKDVQGLAKWCKRLS